MTKNITSFIVPNMNDFNVEYVANNMQEFVDKMSSYEGAKVPGNE